MKIRKKLFSIIGLFFLLSVFCSIVSFAAGVAMVKDGADLLSADEEDKLLELAQTMQKQYGYSFIVLTIDDAEGKTARTYAEDSYLKLADGDDGALYLIDMDNHEIYVATSGEMMYYLYDERLNKLLDDAYEEISEGKYYDCLRVMLADTRLFMLKGIPQNTYTYNETTGETVYHEKTKSVSPVEGLLAAVGALLSGGLFAGNIKRRYTMKGSRYVFAFKEHTKLDLQRRADHLENKFITTRHIPRHVSTGSGSGGGFGGGHQSTIHTGSGGHSFGGGGRKF